MSMRLKILETEIGEALFLRQHHKLEPTFKATELYAKALSVLAAYDEMISATRSRQPRQKLRLGFPDDYALGLLPTPSRPCMWQVTTSRSKLSATSGLANLSAAFQRGDVVLALVTLETRPPSAVLGLNMVLSWVSHPAFQREAAEAVALAAYPEGCVFPPRHDCQYRSRRPHLACGGAKPQSRGRWPPYGAGSPLPPWRAAQRQRA